MAAVTGVRSFGSKVQILCRQTLKLVPAIQQRLMSTDKSDLQKTIAGSQKTAGKLLGKAAVKDDPTKYHVPEYYSHDKDTFADFEVEMTGYRQPQPDPRVPYHHHYPWDKK